MPDRYAQLLDLAHEPIVSFARDGRVRTLNSAAERLTGWSRGDAAGRPAADLLAPGSHADFERVVAHLAAEREPCQQAFVVVRPDGSSIDVEASVGAVELECGTVYTAYLRDVTARRRAERLHGMEHAVARALAAAPTGRIAAPFVLRAIAEAVDVTRGTLWRTETEANVLVAVATWPDGGPPAGTLLAPGEQLAGEAWARAETLVADDAVALPAIVDGEIVGVIELERPAGPLHADERRALETVTGMLGQFAQRRRTEEMLAEETQALAAVARATRGLATATDAFEARFGICEAAREATGASVVFLAEPTEDGLLVRAVSGRALEGGAVLPYDQPTAAIRAFRSGEAVHLPDIAASDTAAREQAAQVGVSSGFIQPVRRRDETLGVLGLAWQAPMANVPSRLRAVIRLLADEAAIAISRADYVTDLVHAARTDPLTGLPNRRAWEDDLGRALARARRTGGPVTVVLLDLDGFKALNDRHGHQAGDRLLKECVAAWRGVLRAGDELARHGGDEFALLAPDCGAPYGAMLAERLRGAMREGTASFGVAEWDGEETAEALVQRADAALYEAKAEGRNRVAVAPLPG